MTMRNKSEWPVRLINDLGNRLNNPDLELSWIMELTPEVKRAFPFVTLTKRLLPKVQIVIINDSTIINALSAIVDGEVVVGLFSGLLLRIIDIVKLMMGNDTDTVLNTTTISNMHNRAEIYFEDGLEVNYNWGDLDSGKALWGEVLIEFALTFIALHEVGHHKQNHFSQKTNISDFSLYLDSDISDIEKEIEADLYATDLLSRNIEMMSNKIYRTFNITKNESYNSAFEFTVMAITTVIYLLHPGYANDYQTRGVRAAANITSFCMQMFKHRKLRETLSRNYIINMHGDVLGTLRTEEVSFEDYIAAWYDKNGYITDNGLILFSGELHMVVLGNVCSALGISSDKESIAKHVQMEHLEQWIKS